MTRTFVHGALLLSEIVAHATSVSSVVISGLAFAGCCFSIWSSSTLREEALALAERTPET